MWAQRRLKSVCAPAESSLSVWRNYAASILHKSIAGRHRPVSYPDGPITARYRFIKNAYWVCTLGYLKSVQWRFLSDCTNVLAKLNILLGEHIRRYVFSNNGYFIYVLHIISGPCQAKKCLRTCAQFAHEDHPAHAQSIIRAFALHWNLL